MPVRIYRYILVKFLTLFVASLAIFTLLFLMDQASRQVDKLAPHARSIADFAVSFSLLLPPLLSYSIPLAFLMAMISSLEQMKQDREITAVLAAGVPPIKLFPPFLLTSVMVVLATMAINSFLAPASYRVYNRNLRQMARTSILAELKPGVFFKGIPGTVILARGYDPGTGRVQGLLMAKESENGRSDIVLAKDGRVESTPGGITVSLREGTLHPMNAHGALYRSGIFDRLTSSVDIETHGEGDISNDQLLMAAGVGELENWIAEAATAGDSARLNSLLIEKHRRVALPLTVLLFPLLVFPVVLIMGSHGKALAFTASIGLFMLSFFLYSIGTRLALAGMIPVLVGTYLPDMVLLVLALPVFLPLAMGTRRFPTRVSPQ